MDMAFEWFAKESLRAAELEHEPRQREIWIRLAMMWGRAAAHCRLEEAGAIGEDSSLQTRRAHRAGVDRKSEGHPRRTSALLAWSCPFRGLADQRNSGDSLLRGGTRRLSASRPSKKRPRTETGPSQTIESGAS